jgi:hypothetical protein
MADQCVLPPAKGEQKCPDLTALAGDRYRIALDESWEPGEEQAWYVQIPCKQGHVYVHGVDRLGAYTDRRGLMARLAELGTVHQRGDREMTVTFDPIRLPEVLGLLGARRQRHPKFTTEQIQRRRDQMQVLNADYRASKTA